MIRIVDALADARWTDVQAELIAQNLRQADREEVAASSGLPPLHCIREGLKLSHRAWIVLDREGVPVSVFGVAPSTVPDVGIVWLLGTDRMALEAVAIGRATMPYIRELHASFSVLFNFVDARNEVSLRWLRWAGFDIVAERTTFGAEQRLFYEVQRRETAAGAA